MDKTGKKWKLSSFESFIWKNAKLLWIILTVFLLMLPFVFRNPYFLTVVAKIGCYIILGLGLNLLTGYTGLVSLGHAGFVAIGAYTASLLSVKVGCPFFPSMLAGMLAAALIGALMGLPTLRVTGTYLSIITLGFGEIVKMVLMNWQSVTNGTLGVKNIPKPQIFGWKLTTANHGMYFLILFMIVLISLFCRSLMRSKTGRALRAIREDEMASTMMGIPVTAYKILAFVLSAVICALGGALYASLIGYIDPNTFNFDVSTLILSIVILGGMGTLRGIYVGAIVLIAFPELSRSLMKYRFVLYGAILVLMKRFRPSGILGWRSSLPYQLSENVKKKLRKEADA